MTDRPVVSPALRQMPLLWRLPVAARWVRERYFTNFVFIHINKTGGSSIERALGLPFDHRTALEKRQDLGTRRWTRRFVFTFVRNPWDKVLSHYAYRVQTNQTGLGERPVDFRTWVRLAYAERDPAYYDQPRMFMPQWRWMTDEAGSMLVDFVGRFERLEADFAAVCTRLGRRATLPHLKQSRRGDYRTYYDDVTAEIVRDVFEGDLSRFDYVF